MGIARQIVDVCEVKADVSEVVGRDHPNLVSSHENDLLNSLVAKARKTIETTYANKRGRGIRSGFLFLNCITAGTPGRTNPRRRATIEVDVVNPRGE